MTKYYFATRPDGRPVYNTQESPTWKDLEDGITEILSSQGERMVWSDASGDFIPVATRGDDLKAGTNDLLLAGNAILTQLGLSSDESLAEHVANPMIPQRNVAPSPEMTKALREAGDSVTGNIKAILTHPLDVGLPMLTRSAPGMVATVLPAILTAPIGGVGGAPGAALMAGIGVGAGSFGVNQGSKYNEVLQGLAQQAGVDINNPTAFAQFVNTRLPDGTLVKDLASQQATAYAGPVAAADALGAVVAGPAGKVIADAAKAGRIGMAAGLTGANIVGQGVVGAGGEAVGQINQTGNIYDPLSVAAEGALEAVGAPAEAYGLYRGIKRVTPEEFKAIVETPVTQAEVDNSVKLEPDDVVKVVNTLRAQGVPLEVLNGWTAPQLNAVAARLKVAESRIPNVEEHTLRNTENFDTRSLPSPVADSDTPIPVRGNNTTDYLANLAREHLQTKGVNPEIIGRASKEELASLGNKLQANQLQVALNRNSRNTPKEEPLQIGNTEDQSKNFARVAVEHLVSKGIPAEVIQKASPEQLVTLGKQLQANKLEQGLNRNRTAQPETPRQLTGPAPEPEVIPPEPLAITSRVQKPLLLGAPKDRASLTVPSLATERDKAVSTRTSELVTQRLQELKRKPSEAQLAKIKKQALEQASLEVPQQALEQSALPITGYPAGRGPNGKFRAAGLMTPNDVRTTQSSTPELPQELKLIQKEQRAKERAVAKAQPVATQAVETQEFAPAKDLTLEDFLADLPTRTPRKFSAFMDVAFGTNPLNGADLTNVVDYTQQFKRAQRRQATERDRRLVFNYTDKVLTNTLKKYGLDGKLDPLVTLERIANGAGGFVEGKTLVIAAIQPQGRSIESTINHEVVHALKNLGLFTPGEWNTLKRFAPEWAVKYGIKDNPTYAELTNDEQLEEAIAEHFAQVVNVQNDVVSKDNGLVNRLGKRIVDFFSQLKNWVEAALGVTTPEEVLRIFDAIQNGEIGSRTNDVAKANLNLVRKYSQKLTEEERNIKIITRDNDLGFKPIENLKKIGFLGRWLSDLANIAAKFPAVTNYYWLIRQLKTLALDIRQKAQDAVSFLNDKHYKDKERKVAFTKAAAFANINNEKLVYPEDGKSLTVTLNRDYGGFKQGESVTLSGREVADLKKLEDSYKGIARQHILAIQKGTIAALSKDIKEGGLGVDFLEKFGVEPTIDDIRKAAAEFEVAGSKDSADNLKVLADTLDDEMAKLRNFYIPQMRTSPYFVDFYIVDPDTLKKGERIATVALPTNMWGGQPSKKVQDDFAMKRLRELQKTYGDDVLIAPKSRLVNVKDSKGLNSNHLSTFERIAESLMEGKSEDVTKLLRKVRQELGTRGFKAQWTNRQDIPGWIHGDNLEGYLQGATGLYGHRAGNSIASAWYSPSINKEIAKLENAVEQNTLDKSVLDYVREHQTYLNSPQNEFDQLRKYAFFYFLGFNPSSAFLNGFQLLHSSLPIMTAMFGGSLSNLTTLTRFTATAGKFLNADVAADNIFKEEKPKDISQEHWDLIQGLRQAGVVREVVTEELSAKSGFVGGATDRERNIKGLVHKAGNVGTSMFSRMEALIRIATALSAYEQAKKNSGDLKASEKLRKYVSTTQYRNEELTPENVAKIAVELSQFDTTRYNRAKALRGKMALPTQFLGFPLKMIQLYTNLLANAFGSRGPDGQFKLSLKDSTTKAAFATMVLGLMATSGILGAIPFGAAGTDGFDKLYKFLTGVDPDIEAKLRELSYDMTGSSMFTDAVFSGFINELTKADIGNRVGLQVFNTFNTSTSLMDVLGPAGGMIATGGDFYERWSQGHELLAISNIMPAVLRNAAKAYYEGEYGIVTKAGDIVPTDYNMYESALQTIGFTPKRLSNTRDIIYQQQRETERNNVAKERYTDALVTLRVKETLARRKGDQEGAQSYRDDYKNLLASIIEVNRVATNPIDKIRLNLDTVNTRYVAQINAAISNKVNQRRVPKNLRGNLQNIENTYGSNYIKG